MSSTSPRLLIISGSARTGSLTRRLAHAASLAATQAGFSVQELDLRALALPVYDGDFELAQGIPAGATALQQALLASDALLLLTPEYNGFPTPLFINAFDWLSRIQGGAGQPSGVAATANKPTALLSASPGALGGLRALNYVRQFLQMNFASLVIPQQFALGHAADAFDAEGGLKEERNRQAVQGVLDALAQLSRAVRPA
ncbi:NAD(P)H-dependent oxidoreductase [Curvibacter sp. RS43]|uniref:NADPH-dependent FMN reductase n=1 Tax=Curvibacter microcysteis TaxID=3026419 RepID=UPI00235EDAC4|nr:NAD(P)H-dependent oxidoreductase [Curvibacter sp. RS43]MDD0809819.1 NAD(P)H-dependent oxidoreductase [Curvibacter sp. RS43]